MTTIVTRAGKGSPLTHAEMDTNLTNLNTFKAEISAGGANTDITSLAALASINGGQLAGLRNRLINGDMRIDQRNNGAAVTPSVNGYVTDRFAAIQGNTSKLTFQQVVDAPAGFKFSEKITVASQYAAAAGEEFGFRQPIEGQNLIDLAFGTVSPATITISLWIKGSVAGNYPLCLFGGQAYIGILPVTTTWAKQTVTLAGSTSGTWATDNTAGAYLQVDLGSGSSFNGTAGIWQAAGIRRYAAGVSFVNQVAGSTLNITGVQLELGSVATPFEQRPYGLEMSLCQRYYQKRTVVVEVNALFQSWALPTQMRAYPTITGGGAGFTISNSADPAVISVYQTARAINTLILTAEL